VSVIFVVGMGVDDAIVEVGVGMAAFAFVIMSMVAAVVVRVSMAIGAVFMNVGMGGKAIAVNA